MDHLYGLSAGIWHPLTRHDPEYRDETRVSERLTALARRKNPDAPDVAVVVGSTVDGPGHGTTVCGLTHIALDRIGVDPDDGDVICAPCTQKLAQET